MTRRGADGVRPVELARLGLGVAALARPDLLLRLVGDDGTTARRVTRALGGRYVVQSGAGLVVRRPWAARVGGLVDLLHAGSMVALAAVSSRHRTAALASAGIAVAFATADLRESVA